MANVSVCDELRTSLDRSCSRKLPKKYKQEAVFININDIDRANSPVGEIGGATCAYSVQMILKALKKGVNIKLPESGNAIKGFVNKSKTDNGRVQYLHQVQILMEGADEQTKCVMDKLDHGLYVVALQLSDETVEIYGWEYGISTGDYTYDLTDGGGGSLIVLQSDERWQESMLPLVYKAAANGDANADFNEQFEAA